MTTDYYPNQIIQLGGGNVCLYESEHSDSGSDIASDCERDSPHDQYFQGAPAQKLNAASGDTSLLDDGCGFVGSRRDFAIRSLAEVVERHNMENEILRQTGLHSHALGSPSRALHDSTCIIFDWDDTLFPTWFVQNQVRPCAGEEGIVVPPMFVEAFSRLTHVIREVLLKARSVGRVSIVTLAQRPWVEKSAHIYLPDLRIEELFKELKIHIFYAREFVKKAQVRPDEEGVNMFVVAKRNAMVKCLGKMKKKYGIEPNNIIALGDSIIEHEAIKEVVWAREGHNLCKSVLFMEKPPMEILSNELTLVGCSIEKMVEADDDFDFNMETGDADNFRTWL